MKCTFLSLLVITLLLLTACRSSKQPEQPLMPEQPTATAITPLVSGGSSVSSPLVYVYKTKADYTNLVPILMDEARTRIVSYPHPNDINPGGTLALPTPLKDGYLLDNRGIGKNVVFLTYTYEEYSKMSSPPSLEDMTNHIADKYPLVELYECGRRLNYKDIVPELNKLIETGFPGCKRVL